MANIINRLFRRRIEAAIKNKFNDAFFGTVGEAYTAYPEESITYLEKGYLYNPTVFAVVNQRAKKVQQIPFVIKKVKDRNAKRNLDRLRMSTKGLTKGPQALKALTLSKKAFEDNIMDFPMERPNPNQTWGDIKGLYETFMCTTGMFYMFMLKGEFSGEPQQVYVLPSHLMQIVLKPKISMQGMESPISHYILTEGNRYIEFNEDEVIVVKTPNPEYGLNGEHLYGLSPLRAALRNIQSSNFAIDQNIKTMLNSGAYGFLHGKTQALTEPQAKELKARLLEMDKSPERLSNIAGVSAEIGFTRLSLTTDELKPFDYLGWDEKQICNVFGWDNVLLNDKTRATDNNVEQAEQRVIVNTIMPSLQLFDQAMTDNFLPLFKRYEGAILEHDYTDLPEMQQDMKQLVEWLSIALADGVLNRDTYRQFIKLPKLESPEMETFTVKDDVIPLADALEENFNTNDIPQF